MSNTQRTAVYLDYNATTPLDPRVYQAMQEWFVGPPSNAGSRTHVYGQRARDAVERARQQVADVLGVQSQEIYFTSGATESNNLAILGLARYGEATNRRHVVSTAIEHKAVLEPLERLAKAGFEIDLAPVTSCGFVEPDEIKRRLRSDTLLVSVMHANNETGVLQPVLEIGELVEDSNALFHTDAAQAFGKEVEELKRLNCDLISISGHKIYGPQGIGAMYIRRRTGQQRPVDPLFFGGGQERGLRPGTQPVALIVGLGAACELARTEYKQRRESCAAIKRQFLADLNEIDYRVNGDERRTQSHVLNLSFPGVDSEAMMISLRSQLAISNGAACTSASYSPSHVLVAMGFDEERISESVRISWGPQCGGIPVSAIREACRLQVRDKSH